MLRVRKLMEKDWELIPKWWQAYGEEGFPRDFLPGAYPLEGGEEKRDGLGGFMVCKEDHPVAAMWLWITNSKTAIPAVVVSDKDYKDADRSDALELLVDYTTDFAEQMGFKYAFGWAKAGRVLEKYQKAEYYIDETPSFEVIKRYGNSSEGNY